MKCKSTDTLRRGLILPHWRTPRSLAERLTCCLSFPNYSVLLSKHTLGDSSKTAVCQCWLEQCIISASVYISSREEKSEAINLMG